MKLKKILKNFSLLGFIKDLLGPKKCYSCQKEGAFLCHACAEKIGYFESICPVCKQTSHNFEVHFYCKKNTIYYDRVMIFTHYKNKTIQKLIKDAKFYHTKDILEDLSRYLAQVLSQHTPQNKEKFLLIPSAMYVWKKISRGYNQSEILVKNLSQICQIPYETKLIQKVRSTQAQSHLSKSERYENLLGAFRLNKKILSQYQGKTVIIVDDVVSTGTTLNEIARLLKKSGVSEIYGLCIASD